MMDGVALARYRRDRGQAGVPGDRGSGHRDIKPDNLFELDGRWVIGGFGLVTYPVLTDAGSRQCSAGSRCPA